MKIEDNRQLNKVSMKIEDNRQSNIVSFKNVKMGECFTYNINYCMKIGTNLTDMTNSISLLSGLQLYIKDNEQVMVVNGKMVIE